MKAAVGPAANGIRDRIAALDWKSVAESLDADGMARVRGLLRPDECRSLAELYDRDDLFRSRVSMDRYRFGAGEYKYFAYPLPPFIAALRTALYPHLAKIANGWSRALGAERRYPGSLKRFLTECAEHGQTRPTPLLLDYTAEGYNRLHQDVYGEIVFPLQVTCLLTRAGTDFEGGEFLLTEHRPRMQTRGEAVALELGEGIVFASRERPVSGTRGWSRAQMRHGVSRIRSGRRRTLGVIFHDAR